MEAIGYWGVMVLFVGALVRFFVCPMFAFAVRMRREIRESLRRHYNRVERGRNPW